MPTRSPETQARSDPATRGGIFRAAVRLLRKYPDASDVEIAVRLCVERPDRDVIADARRCLAEVGELLALTLCGAE